jgi:hypothetical protein
MVVRLSSVLKSKNRKDTDQSLKNLCPKAVWIRVLIFVGIDKLSFNPTVVSFFTLSGRAE